MSSEEETKTEDDDVRFHDRVIRLERKCRYSSDVKSDSCVKYMISLRDLCLRSNETSTTSKNAPASVRVSFFLGVSMYFLYECGVYMMKLSGKEGCDFETCLFC